MSFVAIDLGASNTRYVSENGKIMTSKNYMVELGLNELSKLVPDAEDLDSSMEIVITKEEESEYFPAHLLMGIMADRMSAMPSRPSVNMKKCTQAINYRQAIVTTALSKIINGLSDEIDLYIAVPPIEIDEAREKFKSELVGKYKVEFPKYMNGTSVEFKVRDVFCYQESFMASSSFFFEMNGVVKETNKKYLAENVLSIDIGASTTDIAIIKHGRFLDRSGKSFRMGGNEVRDYTINEVLAEYDMELNIEDAENAIKEGRLKIGNYYEDINEIIDNGKKKLASKIVSSMDTYFKSVGIDIKTVSAIVVSGGGSMESQYISNKEVVKGSHPMSEFVTNGLTRLSPTTEVIYYGEDARFANVKGLFIRANLDILKKAA
jgi:Tfp pilus assembly PilM family ATPase